MYFAYLYVQSIWQSKARILASEVTTQVNLFLETYIGIYMVSIPSPKSLVEFTEEIDIVIYMSDRGAFQFGMTNNYVDCKHKNKS